MPRSVTLQMMEGLCGGGWDLTAAPYCPTCRATVTVTIPVNVGIAEYLERRPPCPVCGTEGLRLTMDRERPVPPGHAA